MDRRLLDNMEQHLCDLLVEHEAVLMLLRRKREALRQARPSVIEDCCQRENEHVQRIGRIETDRQRLVAAMTEAIDPTARQPLRLGLIAGHADEPQRIRLLALQAKLLETMNQVKRESQVTKAAMEGLLKHVHGMVQMLVQTVGGGTTYGQRGRVTTGVAVSSFSTTG